MNKLLKNSGITVGILVALVAIFFLVMNFVNQKTSLKGIAVVTGDGKATGASDSPIPIMIIEGSGLGPGSYMLGVGLKDINLFKKGTLTIVDGGGSPTITLRDDSQLDFVPAKGTTVRFYA